jgi:hypothetical protein
MGRAVQYEVFAPRLDPAARGDVRRGPRPRFLVGSLGEKLLPGISSPCRMTAVGARIPGGRREGALGLGNAIDDDDGAGRPRWRRRRCQSWIMGSVV